VDKDQRAAGTAFAARIRELRERSGESFDTIAVRTGVSGETIRRYADPETVPARIPRSRVEALERALGAQAGELWELLTGVKRAAPSGAGDATDTEQQVMYSMVLQLGTDVHQQAMQALVLERRMRELAESVSEAARATDQKIEELKAWTLGQIEARIASTPTPRSPQRP
jgi:transcriptional regulator with XRE-family HTH domain